MIGRDISPNQDHQFVLRHFQRPDLDRRVYNAPRTQEVGMVIDNDNPETIPPRTILLTTLDGEFYHTTDDFSGYLPIRYPIFFPYGEQGWTHGWPSGNDRCKHFLGIACNTCPSGLCRHVLPLQPAPSLNANGMLI
jgi:hypothetical protein